jgi:hypothetical protein
MRRRSRLSACTAGALLACLIAAIGSAAAAAPEPTEKPATAADCQSLLHQFDVAWAAHRDGPHAASAHHNRDLGEAACGQHQYTDGVRQLRRALHDIGVKPVKIAAAPPAH